MKNKIFSKVGILLAAMVLINTSIQAQGWLDSINNITVHTNLSTESYAQKIKPYGTDYLIALSNKDNPNYCFTAWTNGSPNARKSALASSDFVVNDFVIFDDTLYFCGRHMNNQGDSVGYIGRFKVNKLIGIQNFSYDILDITATEELTNLVAYKDDSNTTHVVAIGHAGATGNPYGRVVCMDNLGHCYVVPSATTPQNRKEIFEDIAVGDNYVATVGRVYPSDSLVVRYYDKITPEEIMFQKRFVYYSANIYLNTSIKELDFPSHITSLADGTMVIATSALNNNNRYFTLINTLQEGDMQILSSRICRHQTKDNKIFEMDYSFETDSLLILHGEEKSNNYVYSTLLLNLQTQPTYTVYAREIPGIINHLSILPNRRYALAGIDTSSNNSQMLYVRLIDYFSSSCGNNIQFKIESIASLSSGNYTLMNQNFPNSSSWNTFTATNDSCSLYIDCIDY